VPRFSIFRSLSSRIASFASLTCVAAVSCIAACKAPVATAAECDTVAQHLAELQIKKEKTPPFGHLVPPFDDDAHRKEIESEAKARAKERCTKGWKREVYDCMMSAQDLDAADKCRFL
jgi:hypothetical protein